MRFMLHYRGPLLSNGGPEHKEAVRQALAPQLEMLWRQAPLVDNPEFLQPRMREGEYCFLREIGGRSFVPLITSETDAYAELRIVMLRPGPVGAVLNNGDIDNRLKSLFDALAMPQQVNQVRDVPGTPKGATYCLLEDDKLVVRVELQAEQLLEPVSDINTVDVTIGVRTRTTRPTFGNGLFA